MLFFPFSLSRHHTIRYFSTFFRENIDIFPKVCYNIKSKGETYVSQRKTDRFAINRYGPKPLFPS